MYLDTCTVLGLFENHLVQSSTECYCIYTCIACGCLQCVRVDRVEYTCATVCDELAGNEQCLPGNLTVILSVYLICLKRKDKL